MPHKKFAFPLQKLLRLREFEEERARIELGRAVSEVERLNLELRENAGKRARTGASRASSGNQSLDMESWVYIEQYISKLDSDRDKLLEELTASELVAEEKRGVYVEASKNLKIVQNLRDKKHEAWRKEYLDAQAEEIDDIINSH